MVAAATVGSERQPTWPYSRGGNGQSPGSECHPLVSLSSLPPAMRPWANCFTYLSIGLLMILASSPNHHEGSAIMQLTGRESLVLCNDISDKHPVLYLRSLGCSLIPIHLFEQNKISQVLIIIERLCRIGLCRYFGD